MLANNETGVMQPIREVAALARERGWVVHCDAAQAFGKIPVDVGVLGVDMLTLSAHKCGGAVGAAALFVRRGLEIAPLLRGGGQESRRRAGTENLPAIAGFAKAAELAMRDTWQEESQIALRDMEATLRNAGAEIIGADAPRLPNTSALLMPGVRAETQLICFDLEGIAVSAGAACSSGRLEPSPVLLAMGCDPAAAASALRVSSGWNTHPEELARFTAAWLRHAQRLMLR
jgi:cysteine desulfurase